MLRRTRTTKKLAKRIDLQYFAHPHPFRSWRFWLSLAVPLLATAWFVAQRAHGGRKRNSNGALFRAHPPFTQPCTLPHPAHASSFPPPESDKAYLSCPRL